MNKIFYLLFILTFLSSCDLPKDPENTFNDILKKKIINAGISENPPYTILNRGFSGREVNFLNFVAQNLGAKINWVKESENVLFRKLEKKELDIVICGLTSDSPWKAEIGISKPYFIDKQKKEHVIAVPPGENKWLMYLEKKFKNFSGKK